MRKRTTLGIAAIAAFGVFAALATNAYAFPTKSGLCSGCHDPNASIGVTAVALSNDGANATYRIVVTGGSDVKGAGVFRGSTKVGYLDSASGDISVPVGTTYTVFGVDGKAGYKTVAISPTAPAPAPVPDPTPVPVPDPTPAPLPVPNPTPAPLPVPDPTPVPVPDPTPVATLTPDPTATVEASGTVRIHVMGRTDRGIARATVTLVNASTGATTTLTADRRGWVSFAKVAYGRYTVTTTLSNGHVLEKALRVHHRRTTLELKDHKKSHREKKHESDSHDDDRD